MSDVYMRILMSAQSGNTLSVVNGVAKSLGGGAGLAGVLGAVGIAAAGLAIGIGVKAVQAAGTFQSSLTSLVTGAGEAQSNIGLVSDGILSLAVSSGTTTAQLTAGMYEIESAGFHGASGLNVLQNAAQGAKVGNADLNVTAKAVTAEMINYKNSHLSASAAVNTLIATVSAGQTNMTELSGAMAGVLPIASKAGVSLTDVSAALATMTAKSVPASDASTYLRQTIMALENPSTKAVKAMSDMGLKSASVAAEMKTSLPEALQMITDAVGKKFPVGSAGYIAAISNIVGGTKSMQGIMNLTGSDMATFKANVDNISGAVKQGGSSITGWSKVQGDFNQKMAQAKEVVETLGIKIGTALMPHVNNLLGKVMPIVTGFANWLTSGNRLQNALGAVGNAVHVLTGFIGGVLGAGANLVGFFQHSQVAALALLIPLGMLSASLAKLAFEGILDFVSDLPTMIGLLGLSAAEAWANAIAFLAMEWPILAIGAAIGIVIGIIVLLVTHWTQVSAFLSGVWAATVNGVKAGLSAMGAFFGSVFGAIGSTVGNFFSGLGTKVHDGLQAVGNFFSTTWNSIRNGVGNFFSGLGTLVHNGLEAILNFFLAPFRAIGALFSWLYDHNTYFKELVDKIHAIITVGLEIIRMKFFQVLAFIVGLWNGLKDKASQAWNAVKDAVVNAVLALGNWEIQQWNRATSWLSNKWNGLKGIASSAWNAVKAAIMTAVLAIGNWEIEQWNRLTGWIQTQWNKLTGLATSAWNGVVGVFKGIWGMISGPLNSMWSNFKGWFDNLATQMLQFGKNLIQQLINGITSMAGAVGNAASNIAKSIAGFLGFHSPAKYGPGADADKWIPNLLAMMMKSIQAGTPQIQAALNLVLRPAVASGSISPSALSPSSVGTASGTSAPASGGGQLVFAPQITLQGLDEPSLEKAGQWLLTYLGNALRSQFGNV